MDLMYPAVSKKVFVGGESFLLIFCLLPKTCCDYSAGQVKATES